jgi:hypothetical protein
MSRLGRPAMMGVVAERCLCGDDDCWYFDAGYPYCRSCREHHRPPECPVDEQGRSLNPSGEPWDDASSQKEQP